jgi:hypothetical protein
LSEGKKVQPTGAPTCLLLFHQLGVRAVIYDITAEDWSRQNRIYVLRIRIFMLRVENEVVPLGAEVDRGFLAEENECKYIAVLQLSISILQHAYIYDNDLYVRGRVSHLCLAMGEELQRVDSVGDSAANDRQPMEHQWWLMWIFQERLPKEIPEDGNGNECCTRPPKLQHEIKKPSHRG